MSLRVTGIAAVACILLICVTMIGLFGTTLLADRAMTVLLIFFCVFVGALAGGGISKELIVRNKQEKN
jgi:hypothetical protein